MREAIIAGAAGLDDVRPRKPGQPGGARRPKGKSGRSDGLMRRIRARAVMLIATASFCAIMAGIVLNATVFQKGHHPSPLFGPAAAPVAAAAPPPPLRQQAALTPAPAPADPVAVSAPVPAAAPVPAVRSHPTVPKHTIPIAAARHDAIAQLLGTASGARTAKPADLRRASPPLAVTTAARTTTGEATAHDHRRPVVPRAAQAGKGPTPTANAVD